MDSRRFMTENTKVLTVCTVDCGYLFIEKCSGLNSGHIVCMLVSRNRYGENASG